MTGPVPPESPSRASARLGRDRIETAIALLAEGHSHDAIRAHMRCGADFVAKAAVEWRRRLAVAADRFAPVRPYAAPPRRYPPPPPLPSADPGRAARLLRVARLRAVADGMPSGPERSTLLHLTDLAEHHSHGYPSYVIRSDGTLRGLTAAPVNLMGLDSSPAASCLEG